jgi:hypothetical protein
MTDAETAATKAAIEEMRDELVVLRERGCTQVVVDIELAEKLVEIGIAVIDLDKRIDGMMTKKPRKVQR